MLQDVIAVLLLLLDGGIMNRTFKVYVNVCTIIRMLLLLLFPFVPTYVKHMIYFKQLPTVLHRILDAPLV